MAEKRFRLSELDLDEVSFVDVPADPLAKVILFKTASGCVIKAGRDCSSIGASGKCTREGCPMFGKICKGPAGVQFVVGFKEGGGSDVQSIIFDSDKWDQEKAKAWLKDHNFTSAKVDETPNTLRYRQHDPGGYIRFRVIAPGAQASKALQGKIDLQKLHDAIAAAVRAKFDTVEKGAKGSSLWIRDLTGDSVIFEQIEKVFQAAYEIEISDKGEPIVKISESVPVEIHYKEIGKVETVSPAHEFRMGQLKSRIGQLERRVSKILASH